MELNRLSLTPGSLQAMDEEEAILGHTYDQEFFTVGPEVI